MKDVRHHACGASGLAVSVVGLGCYSFGRTLGQAATVEVVSAALDAGITLFDTSDTYGHPKGTSEELLGAALRGRRNEAVVATKFGSDMDGGNGLDWGQRGSRRYIRLAVEASLRRLGTDWIDLYQIHLFDPVTPLDETLAALDDLVKEGKVRYVGCSNFAAWQLVDADWIARSHGYSRFVAAQNAYSLVNRSVEAELVPACRQRGVGLLAYCPLANGLLTGKYRRGAEPPTGSRLSDPFWRQRQLLEDAPWNEIEALQAFAEAHGHTLLELAISGLLGRPAIASVITGATSLDQVRANAAATTWKLTEDEYGALDRVLLMRPPSR